MSQIKRKGEEKITKLLKGFVLYIYFFFKILYDIIKNDVCTNMQYEWVDVYNGLRVLFKLL